MVVIVTMEATTLCGSVNNLVTVRVIVVVQDTVVEKKAVAILQPGVTAAAIFISGVSVVSERIGVKRGEAGMVVVPFFFVLVTVIRCEGELESGITFIILRLAL